MGKIIPLNQITYKMDIGTHTGLATMPKELSLGVGLKGHVQLANLKINKPLSDSMLLLNANNTVVGIAFISLPGNTLSGFMLNNSKMTYALWLYQGFGIQQSLTPKL